MLKSAINTSDPTALRYLMSETIFDIDEGVSGLVQESAATAAAELMPVAPRFDFHGGNKRGYLFLTYEKQHTYMSAAAMDAFTKTMAALKLTLDDVAIMNLALPDVLPGKEQLLPFFDPQKMVFLGISPVRVGLLDFPLNTVHSHQNIPVLYTSSFDEMLVDADKKRTSWPQLKTLFS